MTKFIHWDITFVPCKDGLWVVAVVEAKNLSGINVRYCFELVFNWLLWIDKAPTWLTAHLNQNCRIRRSVSFG